MLMTMCRHHPTTHPNDCVSTHVNPLNSGGITIPYALAMAVFIGVIPLALKDSMAAGHLAYFEAEGCKRTMGYHMAYINIFPDFGFYDACMGQTWYLSCDMLLFIVSPLVIYPLWRGKFGVGWKVAAILWWSFLLTASCLFAYW